MDFFGLKKSADCGERLTHVRSSENNIKLFHSCLEKNGLLLIISNLVVTFGSGGSQID